MSMLGPYASYANGEMYENQFFKTLPYHIDVVGVFDRNKLSPKGVLHIGAHECAEIMCYRKLFGDKVLWVEANPEMYHRQVLPIAERNNQKCFNFAAFNTDGEEVTLHIPDRDDMASLLKSKEAHSTESVTIQTKTIDTFAEEESITLEDYDFLNLDVEGVELEVLEGMEKTLSHFKYLIVEASLTPRFEGSSSTLESITTFVMERGYEMLEISSSFKDLGWGDVLFIKK